jgi:hypothetical protein
MASITGLRKFSGMSPKGPMDSPRDKAFASAPAQKNFWPAPVRTATRIAGSSLASFHAAVSSCPIFAVCEFPASGRSRVMTAIAPCFS